MSTSGSPTVRRRLLAAELRRLRASTGQTAEEVGRILGWSKAKISRYELAQGGLKPGDLIVAVAGERVSSLAEFFRKVWALGPSGVAVPLVLQREGERVEARIVSSDREKFLKKPRMHS